MSGIENPSAGACTASEFLTCQQNALKCLMKIVELAFTVNPVTNLERAREFYEGILGLKPSLVFEGNGMAWVEYEIGPGVLALGLGAEQFKPSADGASVALEMENFEEAIRELKERGCGFVLEPMETPVCHMAGVFDSEGNTIIIHKRKASGSTAAT
jgi:predicted enzyme related to lactoylglutathione lyase